MCGTTNLGCCNQSFFISSLSQIFVHFILGSGGNNHAIDYYKETGYPLCVKLGTITQSEAGNLSYFTCNGN